MTSCELKDMEIINEIENLKPGIYETYRDDTKVVHKIM